MLTWLVCVVLTRLLVSLSVLRSVSDTEASLGPGSIFCRKWGTKINVLGRK